MLPKPPRNDFILGILVLSLTACFITLAVIDPSTRTAFTDLTKVAVGTYIGFHIPAPNQKS